MLAAASGLCFLAAVGGGLFSASSGDSDHAAEAAQGAVDGAGRRLLFDKAIGAAPPKALHLFGEDTTPGELLSDDQLSSGGFILHLIGCLYVFLGLAIVCDEYFVPALDVLVEVTGVSDDVAGATFMAAGGSAPELFTSLIGTFMESSVGFGTIVGSAVFNILFVIGMCALKSNEVIQLTWWPLLRDMSYYLLAIGVLALVFGVHTEGEIEWWEALLLFSLYIGYCILMKFNHALQGKVERLVGFTSGKVEKIEDAEDLENGGESKEPLDVISIIRGKKQFYGGKKIVTSIYHVGILKAITNRSKQTVWFTEKSGSKYIKSERPSTLPGNARDSAMPAARAVAPSVVNGMPNMNMNIINNMKKRIKDATKAFLGVEDISKAELDESAIRGILKELVILNTSEFPEPSKEEVGAIIEKEAGKGKTTLAMKIFEEWLPESSYGKELLCECTFQELDANNDGFICEKEMQRSANFIDRKGKDGVLAAKLNANAEHKDHDWEGIKAEVARAWWKSEKKKEVRRLTVLAVKRKPRSGPPRSGEGGAANGLAQLTISESNEIDPSLAGIDESNVKPPEKVENTIVDWFKNNQEGIGYMQFNQWYFSQMYTHHKMALSPKSSLDSKAAKMFWAEDAEQKEGQDTKSAEESNGNGDPAQTGGPVEGEGEENTLAWPAQGSVKDKLLFCLIAPHMFMLRYTIPDCKDVRYKSWYRSAFTMSIVWIGIYSYLMVWWTTVIGNTLGIPDEVMGLTFLAAGTSIPDLMTSVIVAMEGKGDMALSSSIGSNIFDILVGLPIPWLLYSAVKQKSVIVSADTLFGSLLILFGMIFCVLMMIKYYKFKLEKGLGHGMLVLYVIFLLQDIFRNPQISPFY